MSERIARNLLSDRASLREVMTVLNTKGVFGCVLLTAADGTLTGIMTDGDLRRALLAASTLDAPAMPYINRRFTSAREGEPRTAVLARLSARCRHIPILDAAGRPVDLVALAEIWRLGVSSPSLAGNELKYVTDCLATGWISSQGEYVRLFEKALAAWCGVPEALVCANGTAALQLALAALDVGQGDEVILPDVTFGACANAVLHAGAVPVFVDVDPLTWTVDPRSVEAAITERTRAVMAVHLYGAPADLDALVRICRPRGIRLIEDAAEAFGARHAGRHVGTIGDVGTFSFFANKVLTTGEGGAVISRDPALIARMRVLRDHGMDPGRRYWHLEPGFNFRLTNLQAAIGLAQIERAQSFLDHRRALAERYTRALAGEPGIVLQAVPAGTEPVCWLFTLLLDPALVTVDRDTFLRRLATDYGIEARAFFPALHDQPAFRAGRAQPTAIAERLARTGISLPTANAMTLEDVDRVVTGFLALLRHWRQMPALAVHGA